MKSRPSAPVRAWRRLRAVLAARRGAVALVFALAAPVLIIGVGGVVDLSLMYNAKTQLQDATDAAALAVSAATAKNPSISETSLQTIAQSTLSGNYSAAALVPGRFHVCTPTQNDCTDNGQPMTMDTVNLTTTVSAPCFFPPIVPGICSNAGTSSALYASTTTTVGLAKTLEFNMLVDTSGSMIVGASTADVNSIVAWNNIDANWATVHDAAQTTQARPCAFACHDEGYLRNAYGQPTTTLADMAKGLTNAHAAGATTRFDVMQSAITTVINQLQTQYNSQSNQNSKITYLFNLLQFNDSVTNVDPTDPTTGKPKTDVGFTDALTAVSNLYVGVDTYLNEAVASEATALGANGNGSSASTPLKFLIIVTDGLESDFDYDFTTCTSYGYDSNWPNPATGQGWLTAYGCFDKAMNPANCTTLKNHGVVVAVLETPYVPLTGQDPSDPYPNMGLYEGFVRHVIYPSGASSSSTLSAALQSCASPGYYMQASQDSQIAADFLSLVNQFVAASTAVER